MERVQTARRHPLPRRAPAVRLLDCRLLQRRLSLRRFRIQNSAVGRAAIRAEKELAGRANREGFGPDGSRRRRHNRTLGAVGPDTGGIRGHSYGSVIDAAHTSRSGADSRTRSRLTPPIGPPVGEKPVGFSPDQNRKRAPLALAVAIPAPNHSIRELLIPWRP